MSLVVRLTEALEEARIRPEDAATVELAHVYATRIDRGEDLAKLGPALLAALTALGMTPAGRAALLARGATTPTAAPGSPLDELRRRRNARNAG